MAKRYYDLERETKALLKRWEETRGTLPDANGIKRVNEYILRKKGLGEILGGIGKYAGDFVLSKSQNLTSATNANLNTGDIDFSIFGWCKFNSLSSYQSVTGKGAAWGTGEFTLFLSGSGGNPLCFGVRNAANTASSRGLNDATAPVSSVAINTWYFFVAWHDSIGNTLNLQVNNGIASSQSWSQGCYINALNFGIASHSTASNLMDGDVENVGFTKRILSASELTFLYNSGQGRSYLEILAYQPSLLTSMVSYWPLNESNGIRRDWHTGGNHLTAVNNPINTTGIVEGLF